MAVKGWPMTAGSKVFRDRVMNTNDPIVVKLLDAGAVLHAQTTVPEMYVLGVTWSDLWGVTRNPWNLKYAVGAQSGSPRPSKGLWGFKPPNGRVPVEPTYVSLLPSVIGPMARDLPDMIRLENVISGPAPGVIKSQCPKLDLPLSYAGVMGMRSAYSPNQGWARVSENVRRNTEAALAVLERQGAVITKVDLDLGVTGNDIRKVLQEALLSGIQGADMADLVSQKDQLTSYGRHFAEVAATAMGPEQARHAAQVSVEIYRRVDAQVFQSAYQALIMPTLTTSEIHADIDPFRDKLLVDGVEVDPLAGWILTPLWNLLNWNPVLAAPTGLDPQNMPTSIQIVAPTYEDAVCMRVGSALANGMPQLYAGNRFPTLTSS